MIILRRKGLKNLRKTSVNRNDRFKRFDDAVRSLLGLITGRDSVASSPCYQRENREHGEFPADGNAKNEELSDRFFLGRSFERE